MQERNKEYEDWVLGSGQLKGVLGGESIEVTASEIYLSLVKSPSVNPQQSFPHINFKKYNVDASIKIITAIKSRLPEANLRLVLSHHKLEIADVTEVLDLNRNHIIINNDWYPISSSLAFIQSVFEKYNLRTGKLTIRDYLKLRIAEDLEDIIIFEDNLEEVDQTKDKELPHPEITGFKAKFYSYQTTGFYWLSEIYKENFGCILGDEMGLGKTMQVIGLILNESNKADFQAIVICPSSLMENWRRELKKFAPSLTTMIHSGHERTGFREVLEEHQVIITSYDILIRDVYLLQRIYWSLIVCDEAQAIKNIEAQRTKAVKVLEGKCRIAISGTPLENRLSDVWSLADFIAPDFLGSNTWFNENFPDTVEGAKKLEPIISPLILRRMVKDVADDLPERLDFAEAITMSPKMQDLYEEKRAEIIASYGASASLVQIQMLRMLCCDPAVALKDGIDYSGANEKIIRLKEILLDIYMRKEKALIFTSFTKMSDLIVHMIQDTFRCFVQAIDGRTQSLERQLKIDEFSAIDGSAFLVLNPKAAGTGLNITAANHVIHYNPEWNPALEDQASARAHRRGQKLPVFIRRLFYADTVEDFVNSKIEKKRALASAAITGVVGDQEDLAEIYEALQMTPNKKL